MPWQQLVADVGGEYDPETGIPCYREVIWTTPRQSGKTTLVLSWEVQRGNGWDHYGPQKISYSAQSGKHARDKLLNDQFPLLERRLKRLGIRRLLRGMGNEAIQFTNASLLTLLASTEDSGHGPTINLAVRDEMFADVDYRRDQALIPSMSTIENAQLLGCSTMGTDESIPWNEMVRRGRAAVEADRRSGIAYLEWSAPEGTDPDDKEARYGYMPALGRTVGMAAIDHARFTLRERPLEYQRAFMNISSSSDTRILPINEWSAFCSNEATPSGRLTFAIDISEDRSATSIASAGQGMGALVEYKPGTAWVLPLVKGIPNNPVFVIDKSGPARTLIPDLKAAGHQVHEATTDEVVTASGNFYDAVMEPKGWSLRRAKQLDDAAAAVAKQYSGDAFRWARKTAADADISPLVAATLALWGSAALVPVEAPKVRTFNLGEIDTTERCPGCEAERVESLDELIARLEAEQESGQPVLCPKCKAAT